MFMLHNKTGSFYMFQSINEPSVNTKQIMSHKTQYAFVHTDMFKYQVLKSRQVLQITNCLHFIHTAQNVLPACRKSVVFYTVLLDGCPLMLIPLWTETFCVVM